MLLEFTRDFTTALPKLKLLQRVYTARQTAAIKYRQLNTNSLLLPKQSRNKSCVNRL